MGYFLLEELDYVNIIDITAMFTRQKDSISELYIKRRIDHILPNFVEVKTP